MEQAQTVPHRLGLWCQDGHMDWFTTMTTSQKAFPAGLRRGGCCGGRARRAVPRGAAGRPGSLSPRRHARLGRLGRLTRHPRPAGFLRWVRGAGAPCALRGAPCGVPEFPQKGRGRRELGWLGESYTFWAIYPSVAGIISKALWLAGPPVKEVRHCSAAWRAGLVRELHGIRSFKHF